MARHLASRGRPTQAWALPLIASGLILAVLAAVALTWRYLSAETPASPVTRSAEAPQPRIAVPTFTVEATVSSQPTAQVAATEPPPPPKPAQPAPFDSKLAMRHIRKLAGEIGVRKSGTSAEHAASDYVASQFRSMGLSVRRADVQLPGGRSSENVVATKPGKGPWTVVIGGHIDTKKPAPGANDNASGVAVILEVARSLTKMQLDPTLVFVSFGAEEMVDSDPDHHHYGSRAFVRGMSASDRRLTAAMISVDMVGYGTHFVVRDMRRGPTTLTRHLSSYARSKGTRLSFKADAGRYGWSDHEPFELAGIPATWIEWQQDPGYHTSRDTASHVQLRPLKKTGQLLVSYLRDLSSSDCARLR